MKLLALAVLLLADDPTLSDLADVSLLRLDGAEIDLADLKADGPLVLAYSGVGCPISQKYAPRLTRLAAEYPAVTFVGVNANPQDSREDIQKEARELELGFPVLRDFRQELLRAFEVKTTTEVLLFDARGQLAYRGAVDDQYALGAAKPKPTANWLVDALDAVLAGKQPAAKETDAPGCLITELPEAELPEAITWHRDVLPIVQENCQNCHRPEQVGPFALTSYDEAKGWGRMIASVVKDRRMPPWNASEEFDGEFINERRLSKTDRDKILQWFKDGMPAGDPNDAPPPKEFPEGWRHGEPDAVFTPTHRLYDGTPLAEEGFRVPREGTVEYQYFVTQTNFDEDKWVKAVEIRPGAADVVHHVVVGVHDPSTGPFRGDEVLLAYLAVAVPGDTSSIFPEGYAKRLPKGSQLVFQLHYTPNGKERTDISSVALTFADEPPIFEVHSTAILNQRFEIPAGADDHEVRMTVELEEETGILSFFPHMHTRGKDFRYIAHYPDGTSEDLLFSNYDFNWQESYIYEDPRFMPAGTRIECIAHYDNSDANPNNPDPTASVRWGDQSWEEMFVGYYDRVVPLDF